MALAHLGDPRKRAIKRMWCVVVAWFMQQWILLHVMLWQSLCCMLVN